MSNLPVGAAMTEEELDAYLVNSGILERLLDEALRTPPATDEEWNELLGIEPQQEALTHLDPPPSPIAAIASDYEEVMLLNAGSIGSGVMEP